MKDDLLAQGIEAFNRADFFAAHELWEDLWRESVEGPRRTFHQGLVQVAVGMHHLDRDNIRGGCRVLERGLQKLNETGVPTDRIDTPRLVSDLRTVLRSRRFRTVVIYPNPDPGARSVTHHRGTR